MKVVEDWRRLDEETFLVKYGPYAAFAIVLVVMTLGLFVPAVDVTWPVVALALLLIVVPYLPLVKHLAFEGGEEVVSSLLDEAEETVEMPEGSTKKDVERRLSNVESALYAQMRQEPQVAVIRLRVELEDALTELAREKGLQMKEEFVAFHEVLRYLRDNSDAIDQELYDDVRKVHGVTSRAVQSDRVGASSAGRVVRLGLRVLERVYSASGRPVNPDPEQPAFPSQQAW
ncbi:MAG: hypothetical protein ACOCT0_03370 [Halobacteriota archaeon]